MFREVSARKPVMHKLEFIAVQEEACMSTDLIFAVDPRIYVHRNLFLFNLDKAICKRTAQKKK